MSCEIFQKDTNKRSLILKALAVTAIAAAAFVLLNEKKKLTRKTKEALAYEVW